MYFNALLMAASNYAYLVCLLRNIVNDVHRKIHGNAQ